MQKTGGESDVLLDKKALKMRRLSCVVGDQMNRLSHSTTKKVHFPQKFTDHCGLINHPTSSRMMRSAMKKRHHEPDKICDPAMPDSSNGLKDCTKKHKATAVKQSLHILREEYEDSKRAVITNDEEEAAQALFALAQTSTDTVLINGTSEVKPSLHVEPSNKAEDTDNSLRNSPRKKCLAHVKICRFIQVLQTTQSKQLMKVVPDMNQQTITDEYDLTDLHVTNPQNQFSDGCDGHLSAPTILKELPYFETVKHDRSQLSTRILSEQEQYSGCYQNWQSQGQDTMALPLGSSIKILGSKCIQGSLLQVLGSKQTLNTTH